MVAIKRGALQKAGGARKRRRTTSVGIRAKYAPKTARANRSLIRSNASAINKIRRSLPVPLLCDWNQRNSILPSASTVDDPVTFVTNGRALTDFSQWRAVMRQSDVVNRKAQTRVLRMQINIRYSLLSSWWAQISLFIVTLRPDVTNRNYLGTNVLEVSQDYIANRLGAADDPVYESGIRLNPSVFKVWYSRNVTMSQGAFLVPPATVGADDFNGNPMTTYRKGQVTLKMRLNARNPRNAGSWKDIPFEDLPNYNKYILITCVSQQAAVGTTAASSVCIDTDLLCTTMNVS